MNKYFSRKKAFLLGGAIVLYVAIITPLIIINLQNKQKHQGLAYQASTEPTPSVSDKVSLSFSPETLYTSTEQINEVNIQIDTLGKYPTLVQLEIAYDPEVLTQVELVTGTFFPNPQILLNSNDEETGRLSYALSLPSDEVKRLRGSRSKDSSGVAEWTPPRWPGQTGIVAKLHFTVSKTAAKSETSIYFLPKTEILSQSVNIPTQITASLKIYITTPTPSSSPSSFLR